MSTTTCQPSSPYVYGLDMARFLCALIVSTFHLTWKIPATAMLVPFGWIGVQVFFVISGVVIANSAANATPSRFLKGRFFRLYPAAWIAAIINSAVLLIMPFESYRAMGITVARSFDALFYSLILVGSNFLASAYWTLPIELAFYALVFGCLFKGGAERFRLIARILVILGLPYLILLFVAYTVQPGLKWIDLGYGIKNMSLVRHGPFFAIGIYFWLITSQRVLGRIDHVLLALGFGLAGLEIYTRAAQVITHYGTNPSQISLTSLTAISVVVFMLFTIFIFASLQNAASWVPPPFLKTWLRTLGLMTYPYYLIHEVIGGFVLRQALDLGLSRPMSLVLALFIVGLIACLIARRLEPMLRNAIRQCIGWAATLTRTAGKA